MTGHRQWHGCAKQASLGQSHPAVSPRVPQGWVMRPSFGRMRAPTSAASSLFTGFTEQTLGLFPGGQHHPEL